MLEHGVDVQSAIEIADNAGRTPLFEAVEILAEPDCSESEKEDHNDRVQDDDIANA